MTSSNAELFERARRVMPGGVSSPVRAFGAVGGTPRFAASARGAWITDVEGARWHTPQDIKERYASASMLERNIVIFNVRGNEYRLVTVVAYQVGVVTVEWIGTHAEYSKRK